MKLNIYNHKGIHKLRRNQKLYPNDFYLIGSEAVSNSLYFRRIEDLKYAHKIFTHKLSGILEIVDYLFTPKGWLLVIKLKSKDKIESYYKRMRGLSHLDSLKYDVGRIISEVLRTTISSLVGYINRGSKRKGTLVYRPFKRFAFTSLKAMKRLMSKMKRREIVLSNQRKQFRPSLKIWNSKILPLIGLCFLSSEECYNINANFENEQEYGILETVGLGFVDKHKALINKDKLIV